MKKHIVLPVLFFIALGAAFGEASYLPQMDSMEPDSWDNPAIVEPGIDGNAAFMERTFHNEDDEDYFLFVPGRDGLLILETSGDIDTVMYFYNANTREELAYDDDGGADLNARISYRVQAGRRYIARVTGYSGTTGPYGFRAYIAETVGLLLPPPNPDKAQCGGNKVL